jgi:hypothetical protein
LDEKGVDAGCFRSVLNPVVLGRLVATCPARLAMLTADRIASRLDTVVQRLSGEPGKSRSGGGDADDHAAFVADVVARGSGDEDDDVGAEGSPGDEDSAAVLQVWDGTVMRS